MPAKNKDAEIKLRTTKAAKKALIRKAKQFAGGNLSLWLETQGLHADPATDPEIWKRLTPSKGPSTAPIQAAPGPAASGSEDLKTRTGGRG